MKNLKVIITGATGMVGEGVLMECLQNENVAEVLMVNRRHYELTHPKLKELLISDFSKLSEADSAALTGYDACFYCAGISSVGLKEDEYTKITYDTTIQFAQVLLKVNPEMVFNFVSGRSTDGSAEGKVMWARVKGKTENALMKMGFKGQYNFRPGFMKPFKGQKNVKTIFRILGPVFYVLFAGSALTLKQVGEAMINVTQNGYPLQVLEVKHIKTLAAENKKR